ncbi:glycosyltransferase [Pseudomonadota bacterium]|jgi:glycosyltransferase involved in cell wall biosynthesis|nr:glycosyltransferase [Pseudomonadota bacterium]
MLGVIVPARNEAKVIHLVLENLKKAGIPEKNIFVVDNKSTDNTKKNSLALGVNVLSCKEVGYQSALNYGLQHLRRNLYSQFLIVDGDNEITFNAIHESILNADQYDLIVGSRPMIKRIGEKITNFYCYKRFGIKDIMCGLKLGQIEHFNPRNQLAFGIDLLNLTALSGKKILNLPISLNSRQGTRLGNPFIVNARLLLSLMRYHFGKKSL